MKAIQAYQLDENYTKFLRQFSDNVKEEHNEDGRRHYLRPYISPGLEINGMTYFIPLTSPRPKHMNMNVDRIDFVRLQNGSLGIVNINNMIPVPNEIKNKILKPVNRTITNYDNIDEVKYKTLLARQIASIARVQKEIKKKAQILYKQYIGEYNNPPMPNSLRKRCSNYPLLEEKARDYTKFLQQQQEQDKAKQNNTKQNRAEFQQNIGTLLEAMQKADALKVTIQIETQTQQVTQTVTQKQNIQPVQEITQNTVSQPAVSPVQKETGSSLIPKPKDKPVFQQISSDLYVCSYDGETNAIVTKDRKGYTAKIGKKKQPERAWFKKERLSSLKDAQNWCDKFYQNNLQR